MFKDTIELKNTLIDWLYETIDQYYLEEIEEIVDDNSDKIYEIIENLVGDQLYIIWYRYEYILDFYTEDEINEIVDWLGIDRNDTYEILFRIFDDLLCEDVDDVRNHYKKYINTQEVNNMSYKTELKKTLNYWKGMDVCALTDRHIERLVDLFMEEYIEELKSENWNSFIEINELDNLGDDVWIHSLDDLKMYVNDYIGWQQELLDDEENYKDASDYISILLSEAENYLEMYGIIKFFRYKEDVDLNLSNEEMRAFIRFLIKEEIGEISNNAYLEFKKQEDK